MVLKSGLHFRPSTTVQRNKLRGMSLPITYEEPLESKPQIFLAAFYPFLVLQELVFADVRTFLVSRARSTAHRTVRRN